MIALAHAHNSQLVFFFFIAPYTGLSEFAEKASKTLYPSSNTPKGVSKKPQGTSASEPSH